MFETKILLTKKGFLLGKKEITWDSIAEVRISGENFPTVIIKGFKTINFILKNGEYIYISDRKNIFFHAINNENIIKITADEAILIIRKYNTNIYTSLIIFFEWRFALSVTITQIITLFLIISNVKSLDQLVPFGMIYGFIGTAIGAIIGFIWVKKSKKIINSNKE